MTVISVIVPSYRRPDDLRRCLDGLVQQRRQPDELLVVRRRDDDATASAMDAFADRLPIRDAAVDQPGQVHALNAGLAAASGDVVCFTDDDAVPTPRWLELIEHHLAARPDVAGVGGRDRLHLHGHTIEPLAADKVGTVAWWGRCTGNHHLGTGKPREVDLLKGANMAFRRGALAELPFDDRLRGRGAQVGNELGICLGLRRQGWRLIYDPEVLVDHYPALRPSGDDRGECNLQQLCDAVHNQTFPILDHLGPCGRLFFSAWSLSVGTRAAPGLLQVPRLAWRQSTWSQQFRRFTATIRGRYHGWRTWKASRRDETACSRRQRDRSGRTQSQKSHPTSDHVVA